MFQPIVFKNHIKVRSAIEDERIWDIQQRWEKIIRYVAKDLPGFLAYVREEMTEDEFGWLSDVYEREISVTVIPGFAESLIVACARLPECGERLGVLKMLARNGIEVPAEVPCAKFEPREPEKKIQDPVIEPVARAKKRKEAV